MIRLDITLLNIFKTTADTYKMRKKIYDYIYTGVKLHYSIGYPFFETKTRVTQRTHEPWPNC